MPISLITPRAIDVVRVQANAFKILGFEVRTDSDDPAADRAFVRKEARHVVDGVIVDRAVMRGTEYTATTMLPVLADIGRRFFAQLGLTAPTLDDATLGYLFYVAFRDGLYEAERRSGEFPVDAR